VESVQFNRFEDFKEHKCGMSDFSEFLGVTNVFPKSKLAYSLGMHSVIIIESINYISLKFKLCTIQ